jgi:hypothetical protein
MMLRIKTNASYRSYEDFLEHAVIVADRFKISISEAIQRIFYKTGEYEMFLASLEIGNKTMQDLEKDCQQTFIYKNHEEFYRANGESRDWLNINKLN